MTKTAFYAGSFDPPTNGHFDIIGRALRLADHLVLGVGVHHLKTPFMSTEDRIDLLNSEAAPLAKAQGAKISVVTFDNLVVDAARSAGAAFMIRGLRNGADFEYEAQMNGTNSVMAPELETVFLAASPAVSFISSTLVRQIATMGGDISPFVPASVAQRIGERLDQ
ncbi:MAG: pantetheine-phosphate adenylyltransferase [Hyphomicrobiales bacterium]